MNTKTETITEKDTKTILIIAHAKASALQVMQINCFHFTINEICTNIIYDMSRYCETKSI